MSVVSEQSITVKAATWTFNESEMFVYHDGSKDLTKEARTSLEAFGLKTQAYTQMEPSHVIVYPSNRAEWDDREAVLLYDGETVIIMGYNETFFKPSDRA